MMKLTRRHLLAGTACVAGCAAIRTLTPSARHAIAPPADSRRCGFQTPPAYSITPIVQDGKWYWKEQPADQTGYLDPRDFEFRAGIRWRSDGIARNLRSSTVVPVAFPEQELIDVRIEKSEGCEARIAPLTDTAAQLQVLAPWIEAGQTITATALFRIRLFRQCPHYSAEQFPFEQTVPPPIVATALGNSPGIRCETPGVRHLAASIISRYDHPWTQAGKFFAWVWDNIQGKPGAYTSVQEAIRNRAGDCEERAGVFVALCRASGIPARLVLVPNHCWAEFCLVDVENRPRWIPAHTAAYNWFGWTGAHELVLQKGDRFRQPGKHKTTRLIGDWYSFEGRRPLIEYVGDLSPIEGPGQRIKNSRGGWDLGGTHPQDKMLRV